MPPRVTITPQLREWILATTRAGHGVAEVLQLLKDNGYDPRHSRSAVAEVLKLPLAALHASTSKGQARRPSEGKRASRPQAPEVVIDGQAITVSVNLDTPALQVLDGVMSASECQQLIELARPRLQRALTVDSDGKNQIDQRRTSEGMFFALNEVPLVGRIERRLASLLGLPTSHGEGLQILHYLPGQEYEPHFDWFDREQPGFDRITKIGGQRIASVVMYLNTPQQGGGTAFPEIGLTVTARQGSAVFFAYEGGDQNSLHAGLPVLRGEKWIATKWLRERPYRGSAKS